MTERTVRVSSAEFQKLSSAIEAEGQVVPELARALAKASPLPEGRADGREAWEVEADVLDLARRTVLGATAIDQDRYGPGLRFAGAALEAMAYERRNHDWIESVRAAAPVVGEREEKP